MTYNILKYVASALVFTCKKSFTLKGKTNFGFWLIVCLQPKRRKFPSRYFLPFPKSTSFFCANTKIGDSLVKANAVFH